jgi:hypothetical protein
MLDLHSLLQHLTLQQAQCIALCAVVVEKGTCYYTIAEYVNRDAKIHCNFAFLITSGIT